MKKILNPVTQKMFDISTAHITAKDNNELLDIIEREKNNCADIFIPYQTADGFIILLCRECLCRSDKNRINGVLGLSDAFIGILDEALSQGCSVVWIDANGQVYDEMEKSDW